MDTVTVAPDCSTMMYVIIGQYSLGLSDTNMVTNSKLREHILLIRMRPHDSVITGYIIRKNNDKYILCYVTTGFADRSSLIATTSCADMFYSSQSLWAGYNSSPFPTPRCGTLVRLSHVDRPTVKNVAGS